MADPVPQPPDTTSLPVSSNLASAISDSGQNLAALATPFRSTWASGGRLLTECHRIARHTPGSRRINSHGWLTTRHV